ncbi:UNVERIFIED_CONTAM: hypothetical protein RMT77_010355 [Armadillidium vulgare]
MAEKQMSLGSFKTTVPAMKLFAAGELDRTPPSCIPRLCNVTVTRLQVLQPLGVELASVTLAVKMQNSKRILRSNEIPLTQNGLLDTELQLSFSLQYPHFLKRDGNTLQIMLQRRKKYKNRTFLGCKTLALGLINMSQVLQRPIDRDLDLYFEGKDKSSAVAKVNLVSLSSQPVDTEEPIDRPKHFFTDNPDRVVDLDDSDEDEDYSSQDDGSDSEPILDSASTHHHHHHHHHHLRSNSRSKSLPPNARQRNLKQRFIALLKRFKVPEALQAFDQDQDLDTRPDVEVDEAEIEDLFDELEDLSDSGPEVDTISITSTPKPSLRPYFSSSRSLLTEGLNITGNPLLRLKVPGTNTAEKLATDRMSDESSKRADSDHMEAWTDQEQSDTQGLASSPPREDKSKSNKSKFFRDPNNMSLKEKRGSSSSSTPRQEKIIIERTNSLVSSSSQLPRKVLLEHLGRILPLEDIDLPDHIILVNTVESHGSLLAGYLTDRGHRVITTMAPADVRATIAHLVHKLQKFCNSNAKAPGPMKIVIIGSDTYINCVLRPYVEQFSSKPPDFQNHFRFFSIPLAGVNSIAKYLASIDSIYGATFVSDSWKEVIDKWEKPDVQEAVNRIQKYLTQAQYTLNLPIAEAMITYKGKSDDESCQAFIPFITDVRLGSGDVTSSSVDLDDPVVAPSAMILPGSPPAATTPAVNIEGKQRENITPPPSPNISASHINSAKFVSESVGDREPLDLQVDYWVIRALNREEREKDKDKEKTKGEGGKYTVKGTFRTLQVARLAPLGVSPPQDPNAPLTHLTFSYATKEKKQRIMRLGKKKEREKESESRREVIDGICRLLASTRNQPLKVAIDSVEWTNVKFFQISSQWQTQIKTFPVALFSLQ